MFLSVMLFAIGNVLVAVVITITLLDISKFEVGVNLPQRVLTFLCIFSNTSEAKLRFCFFVAHFSQVFH